MSMDLLETINWILQVGGYAIGRGRKSESVIERAADHDDKGTALSSGSGKSCTFRTRRGRMSCNAANLEHPDQEAGGVSGRRADRAQCKIFRAYSGGASSGPEGAPDRGAG